MDLSHEFDVGVPVERAWALFSDLSRVIPNLPGAGYDGAEDEVALGNIKVKIGPVTAQYKGKAWYLEQDEAAGKVVVRAEGRDTKGQGNAKATISIALAGTESGTHADVQVEMAVTGRLAQIGRGLIKDVSAKLMGQFVDNLEAELAGEAGAPSAPEPVAGRAQAESTELALPLADDNESEPVDLLATAGAPLAKRVVPILAVMALLALMVWLLAG